MSASRHQLLRRLLEQYHRHPTLLSLKRRLQTDASSELDIEAQIGIYEEAMPVLGDVIRASELTPEQVESYQALFRELEALYAQRGHDDRHHFIVVIPVADRPRHLQTCLQSLLQLCRAFHYGGRNGKNYAKVSVLIADDSQSPENIQSHRESVKQFTAQGLETHYFGLPEQQAQLNGLCAQERASLRNVVGDYAAQTPPHKGASLMRNIAYLKLAESLPADDRLLCLFVDSDQEFQTVIEANGEERQVYALNYFYELDRIFTQQDISVVTGKVVGDPPVSPAVMAGTFLDDIILFLQQISTEGAENSCCMHHQTQQQEHAASYHDLAELFGFSPPTTATRYRCRLTGAHHNAACFSDFAGRLNAFLYGEHPTRKTYFDPKMGVSEVSPARTIYTGNYVMKRACLDYFIPFAGLKLRMAGPVLGRIIKSEIGAQFVSANLPLLHNRTLEESGSSEFRPGVAISDERIDLCGEFERQFFGDVMLFSIERLTQLGFPKCHIDRAQIMQKLITTAEELRAQYADKQRAIETKLERLRSLFEASDHWWNRDPELADACERFRTFITNLAHNFAGDSACYQSIDTPAIRHDWLNRMADAILSYPDDRQAWQRILLRRRP